MSNHFFITPRKWPAAVSRVMDGISGPPRFGDVSDLSFSIGLPHQGSMVLRIDEDGGPALTLGVRVGRGTLRGLRDWMERCLLYDREGDGDPELATLDTSAGVCYLMLVHAGWEPRPGGCTAISSFAVIAKDRDEPLYARMCETRRTVGLLYRALLEAVGESGARERLPDCVRSREIELKTAPIDAMCH